MERNIDPKYENENDYGYSNIPNDSIKKRSCLMCGKMFNSKSIGNRRCPRCSTIIKIQKADISSRIYKVHNDFETELNICLRMIKHNRFHKF